MIGRSIATVFVFAAVGQGVLAQADGTSTNGQKIPGEDHTNPRLDIGVLAPEHQLDFWLGEWDATWERGKGTNSIKKTLDGRVIQEHFVGSWDESQAYHGKSFSVYVTGEKKWKQTWVDNLGAYLDLTGRVEGSTFIFMREEKRAGQRILQRMVYSDIRRNSYTWDWQLSRNDGRSWESQWKIQYTRKK